MKKELREAFESEMTKAKRLYSADNLSAAFHHLERAHILGQRFYVPHVVSHWWMLKVGLKRSDLREIFGQLMRIIASAGSLLGWVPAGNTGGADVSPIKPMPIPDDLASLLKDERAPSMIRFAFRIIAVALIASLAFFAFWLLRHNQKVALIDAEWREQQEPQLANIAAVRDVTIQPLVNWRASDPAYATEAGVSYLLQADRRSILFDLGSNKGEQAPSPLEANMALLQISVEAIDAIFLSHHHFDHVGGREWAAKNTFSFGVHQPKLSEKIEIFAPIPLEYPGHPVTHITAPKVIAPGIASIGPIKRQLLMGQIQEQALALHVEGKGILLVIGCGHQTLRKIVSRTKAIFDAPIFAIVGDLHYPVPDGRMTFAGVNLQRTFASSGGLFSQLKMADVEEDFDLLESLNLEVLAMGSHDTSDTVLEMAARRFPDSFQRVEVGKTIKLTD